MLNSFYNSVYSRTNNFGFPQRFNLTLAVILIFIFGFTYIFRIKLQKFFSSIKNKKHKSKLGRSASKIVQKISPWGSRLQVMATNVFFLFMPENINYIVIFLKNAYQIQNVFFMIYNLLILFLFVKIFADFLMFYIDTLVKILIRKTNSKEGAKKEEIKGKKGKSVDSGKKENNDDKVGDDNNKKKELDEVQMIAVKGIFSKFIRFIFL